MILTKRVKNGNFDKKLKNYKISCHTKITDLKATMKFEDKAMTMAITNPEVRFEFDYVTKGVMFLMPIDTSGPGLIAAQNTTYTVTFTFEDYTRDKQNYFLVIDTKLEMDVQSMTFHFENLFKDKVLNEAFNRELDANTKKVLEYTFLIYLDGYAQGYERVFNNFLEKIPLTELFDGL
ncbi:hypothetical protein MTP99_006473 [Tenebrio molitor]|nr:hypothetical protein MTP99_006473 [Tenebrio molitor]